MIRSNILDCKVCVSLTIHRLAVLEPLEGLRIAGLLRHSRGNRQRAVHKNRLALRHSNRCSRLLRDRHTINNLRVATQAVRVAGATVLRIGCQLCITGFFLTIVVSQIILAACKKALCHLVLSAHRAALIIHGCAVASCGRFQMVVCCRFYVIVRLQLASHKGCCTIFVAHGAAFIIYSTLAASCSRFEMVSCCILFVYVCNGFQWLLAAADKCAARVAYAIRIIALLFAGRNLRRNLCYTSVLARGDRNCACIAVVCTA